MMPKEFNRKERIFHTAVTILFVMYSLVYGYDIFWGVDACYHGFFADWSYQYASDCEAGTGINSVVGYIWVFLSFAILLALLNVKDLWLRFAILISIFLQFLYRASSYVFYFWSNGSYSTFLGHALNLITLSILIYLMSAIFRSAKVGV